MTLANAPRLSSTAEVLDALESSDFNLKLASEKLGKSSHSLLAELTPEAQIALQSKMRFRASLELYKTWSDMKLVFIAALAEAAPEDIIKGFIALTKNVGDMFTPTQSNSQTNNIQNNATLLLNMLPPKARDAVIQELESMANEEDDGFQPDAPHVTPVHYLPRRNQESQSDDD